MPLPGNRELLKAQLYAGGGHGGARPRSPMLPGEWRPGMPCHWTEDTKGNYFKHFLHRILACLHFAAGITYVQFRARATIGVFTKHPGLVAYQVVFLVLEFCSVFEVLFKIPETWRASRRNSVDFKRIPNALIATNFAYGRRRRVRQCYSNWPSVGVFIPCYNEDVGLVRHTVVAAVNIDYPTELLTVYLCDDGKDDAKLNMIASLRSEYSNLHYVIRPNNSHAKAGNLNYSLARTTSDLIVTLDADFVARPNILQRMVPYYYNWNPETSLYEFNDSLACVQTPQHFRNLSPYDSDPLDQRATLFFDVILPCKDWWNASTMIGTTNLLSRLPAMEVGFYPYHSVTEDSAMSLAFHSAGYRTYYLNESLAHGLACTSFWSNIGQRARWLKGDWQILFNLRKGPIFCEGLSLIQRLLYLHMSFSRVISLIHLFYEVGLILLLVASISPLDAVDARLFLYHLAPYLVLGLISRQVLVFGGRGLDKSESGSVAFEAVFRYHVITGLLVAIFKGKNIKFKVTDKSAGPVDEDGEQAFELSSGSSGEGTSTEKFDDEGGQNTILGQAGPKSPRMGMISKPKEKRSKSASSDLLTDESEDSRFNSTWSASAGSTPSGLEKLSVGELKDQTPVKPPRKSYFERTPAERGVRRSDIWKNLPKVWFNVFMMLALIFSIVWAVLFPPAPRTENVVKIDGESFRVQYASVLPVAMAIGFAGMSILPHAFALFLAFRPYTREWMLSDFVHGRCDQYAVHPKTGRLFVPMSYISYLTVAKGLLMLGSLGALVYFIFGPTDGMTLVPV